MNRLKEVRQTEWERDESESMMKTGFFFLVAKNVGGQSQLIKDPVWPETVNNVSAPALM